jgi:hypothetical protein
MKNKLSINSVLKDIQDEILLAIKKVMIEHGVKRKADLYKTLELKAKYNSLTLYAYDYYEWLSTGRKKFQKKVPLDALIYWIRHYRIPSGRGKNSVTRLAFKIQNAIYKNGIQGKGYIDAVGEVTEEIMQERLQELFGNIIISDIDEVIK